MSFPSMSAVVCASIFACLYQGQVVLGSRPQENFDGKLSKDSDDSVRTKSVRMDAAPPGLPDAAAPGLPASVMWKVDDATWEVICQKKPPWPDRRERVEFVRIRGDVAKLLEQLRGKSPYVASLVGYPAIFEKEGYAMMEWFSRKGKAGDSVLELGKELCPFCGQGRDVEKATWFWQLVKGMRDLHDLGVVHNGISLENTAVNCENHGKLHRHGAEVCYAALTNLDRACFMKDPEKTCVPDTDVKAMAKILHYLFINKRPKEWNDGRGQPFNKVITAYLKRAKDSTRAKKVVYIVAKVFAQGMTSEELLAEAGELLKIIVPEDVALRTMLLSPAEHGARRPHPPCLDMKKIDGTGVCKDAPLEVSEQCQGFAWEDPDCKKSNSFGISIGRSCQCCHCKTAESHFNFFLQSGCKPKLEPKKP